MQKNSFVTIDDQETSGRSCSHRKHQEVHYIAPSGEDRRGGLVTRAAQPRSTGRIYRPPGQVGDPLVFLAGRLVRGKGEFVALRLGDGARVR